MEKIEVFTYTSSGGRENNEDYCNYDVGSDHSCYVLTDGLGGHESGEIASERAGSFLLERLRETNEMSGEILSKILKDANQHILDGQKDYPEMRTTAAAVYIRDGQFWEAHVGDSRIYLFKNGCLYFQSRDHSLGQLSVEMGDISSEELRFHPDRSKLLKALGEEQRLKILDPPESIALEPNDAFLLCSDGFWEYVWETEMEIDLIKSSSPKEWVMFMLKRLLSRAPQDRDNATVIAGIIRETKMGGDFFAPN